MRDRDVCELCTHTRNGDNDGDNGDPDDDETGREEEMIDETESGSVAGDGLLSPVAADYAPFCSLAPLEPLKTAGGSM